MSFSPHKLETSVDFFEQLQARFPMSADSDPNSPIASGNAALERRVSNRAHKLSLPIERSRTASPSPGQLQLNLDIDDGIRSTASSPGPPRMTERPRMDRMKRAAPPPPLKPLKTKLRPMSELFLPTPTTAKSIKGFRFSKIVLEEGEWLKEEDTEAEVEDSAPVLEQPLSPISAHNKDAISRLDVHASVLNAINNVGVPDHARSRFTLPPRSSTAPPTIRRQPSFLSIKSNRSLPLRALSRQFSRAVGNSSRGAGVRPPLSPWKRGSGFSGIDKDVMAEKRASAMMTKRREDMDNSIAEDPDDEEEAPKPLLKKATMSVMPWRRPKRGETMSMLIDGGFFPIQEFIYNNNSPPGSGSGKKGLGLSIVVKDLPMTRPSSIMQTPTEMYHRSSLGHRRSVRNSFRRPTAPYRRRVEHTHNASTGSAVSPTTIITQTIFMSPMSPASPTTPLTPSKALSALTGGLLSPSSPLSPRSPITPGQPHPSPGILEVIPEDANMLPDPSQIIADAPPLQTEIHLSTGTVLTVKPPELTASRRSVYIQGPIKLPMPAVVPRKDSIASLAPFQDAIPLLQQPRRQSEDASADDICAWYTSWGFEDVGYVPDTFSLDLDEGLQSVAEEPEFTGDSSLFGISTPVAPLAQEIAAAMLGDSFADSGEERWRPRPSVASATIPLPALPNSPSHKPFSDVEGGKSHSRNTSGGGSSSSGSLVDSIFGAGGVFRSDSRGSGGLESGEEGDDSGEKGNRRGSVEGLKAKAKVSGVRRFFRTASGIL